MSKQGTTAVARPIARGVDLDWVAALDGHQFPHMLESAIGLFGVTVAAWVVARDSTLWFCSRQNVPSASAPREGRLWDVALATDGLLVVDDLSTDERFAAEPNTLGGAEIRFFVSGVLHAPDGRVIGLLCLADPGLVDFDMIKQETLTAMIPYAEAQLASIDELDRAAQVQRALLPKTVPPLPGYEVAATCVPSKAVGGDFFDWYPIEGGIAFTLADVMGKGVGAGIIAATVRATLRTATDDEDVVVAIQRTAETLSDDLSEAGSFVTLFHGRLRIADGLISFVDAGHGLTVVVEPDGAAHRLFAGDLPLGASWNGSWQGQTVTLGEGATLITFSDGVLDLYDGGLDSIEHVAEIARRADTAQGVADEIEKLALRAGAPDDVTAVVIRRTRAGKAAPHE